MCKKLNFPTCLVLVLGITNAILASSDPYPADGATFPDSWVILNWSPGMGAVSYDVYIGTEYSHVQNGTENTFRGNQLQTFFIVGFPGFPYPDGLVPGTTYYWRIDDHDAAGMISKGPVWSFTVPPKIAYDPVPSDGDMFVWTDVTLSWKAGMGAILHHVYLGESLDYVEAGTGGTYKGSVSSTTYAPGLLELGKTYYWRIDEFDGTSTYKGNVWSFTVTTVTREVEGGLSLARDALIVTQRAGFDVIQIEGFVNRGIPGAPSLPEQIQQIAIPRDSRITSFEIEPGAPVRLEGPIIPLPAQEPIPDVGTDPEQFGDGVSVESISIHFTPPNPEYYDEKRSPEQKLVEVLDAVEIGPIQFVAVRVRPVQYDPGSEALTFYRNLRYRARFNDKEDKEIVEIPVQMAEYLQYMLWQEDVYYTHDFPRFWLLFPEDFAHVIITDNYRWPELIDLGGGATRPPRLADRGDYVGDIVAEFERLAKWKSQKGLRSRVVTISDIVGGRFGDFTEGGFALDLQEVLRNFIKHIHQEWETSYVLFGGDVHVVPMRYLTGCGSYHTFGVYRSSYPSEGRCYRVPGQNVMKLWPQFTPKALDPLSTYRNGVRIPFDRQAGPNQLGWYFTTENDFKDLATGFTVLPPGQTSRFVIVEGPVNIIDQSIYYWVRDVNKIPSDLYYASLEGPGYSVANQHDFDSNGNGIYGQYDTHPSWNILRSVDGVLSKFDIRVGRASVESPEEAERFVDKVITYERLQTPNGDDIDTSYLERTFYAADYLHRHFQWRQNDTTIPPATGRFTHVAGTQLTKINSSTQVTVISWLWPITNFRLVARHNSYDEIIPYRWATGNRPVWYFMTDDTYSTKSTSPTQFVLVEGSEVDVDPEFFFWDPIGIEQGTQEAETLRGEMQTRFPSFTSVQRFYWDYFPPISSPPHVEPIQRDPVLDALDHGTHFVNLNGHGSPAGCCYVSRWHDFDNAEKLFVAFAMSCSTARPDPTTPYDNADSLAEIVTRHPGGGGVGYVGFTRYGWIGTGDDYQDAFWRGLYISGELGLAAASRWTLGLTDTWTYYAQVLFGDPEIPVWTTPPSHHNVVVDPNPVTWGDNFNVKVLKSGLPSADARVTLLGGWTTSASRPRVLISEITAYNGSVSFQLPSSSPPLSDLTLTVTKKNCKPYVAEIQVLSN